jgi:UDP-2,3-diacylglucosamine pyrophosphatase LpxH
MAPDLAAYDRGAIPMTEPSNTHYRTVWISDVHLGTRGCQPSRLLDFLRSVESDTLYLVGDIIDFWRLRRRHYWPQEHNDVIQKLLRKARRGTKVMLVPGNHDDFLRDFYGMEFGKILIRPDHIHLGADGRRILVIHGDQFDSVVKHAPWLAHLGTGALAASQVINQALNWCRRRMGLPYWSLSGYLKHKVKHRAKYIAAFDQAMAAEVRRRGVDGVVCGHLHAPAIRETTGFAYYNDGDWVDNCTAVVEHHDGRMELLHWPEPETAPLPEPEPAPESALTRSGLAAQLRRLARMPYSSA